MNNEIVAIYCLCDDSLKAMNHRSDAQQQMSDAEVMTTSVPEPFTIVGTLVGGTAALRMRKKLKSTAKA